MCAPFAEEKLIAHRTLVNLSRQCAQQGICCMRFDEMGHGDSEGAFEEATIETRLSDIHESVAFLRTQTDVGDVCLLGVRLGGSLAAMACADCGVDTVITIEPVIDGRAYMEQCLRSNLTTQLTTYKENRERPTTSSSTT